MEKGKVDYLYQHEMNKSASICLEMLQKECGRFPTEVKEESQETLLPLPADPAEFEVIKSRPRCVSCKNEFTKSWLFDRFRYNCCDACKDPREHTLITRLDAYQKYFLTGDLLDQGQPTLKFITWRNTFDVNRGKLKLYLESQVRDKAMAIWGSEENMTDGGTFS